MSPDTPNDIKAPAAADAPDDALQDRIAGEVSLSAGPEPRPVDPSLDTDEAEVG